MSSVPKAQFRPMLRGFACATEIRKASDVCPDNVLPLASVIVPDIIIGRVLPIFSK